MYQNIKNSLRQLYLEDDRPWLVGFSGGKDSTMVASLVFDTVLSVPEDSRKKPVSFVCTDTRVEIPAIVEMIEGALARMKKFSQQQNLNIDAHLLKPPPEQSFWVNIIGRGYPPPNRTFRWCTQRMKIDPVTNFVNQRLGHWGEAILHLGARRNESSTRAQLMAGMETTNGLRRHRAARARCHRAHAFGAIVCRRMIRGLRTTRRSRRLLPMSRSTASTIRSRRSNEYAAIALLNAIQPTRSSANRCNMTSSYSCLNATTASNLDARLAGT